MEAAQCDLLVIGGGPGGYVAAIRAAQLGLKVVCVDRRELPGGTCLQEGCIPSKALLTSSLWYRQMATQASEFGIQVTGVEVDLPAMMARKERIVGELSRGIAGLFKKHGVTWMTGEAELVRPDRARLVGADGEDRWLTAGQVVLATGSEPLSLPLLPVDGRRIIEARHALSLASIPRHLLVVGAGVIGLELGSIWHRLGAQVTVVEALPEILPHVDEQLVRHFKRIMRKQGLQFYTDSRIEEVVVQEGGVVLMGRYEESSSFRLEGDVVLVAAGRRPRPRPWVERVGIAVNEEGFIRVDKMMRTTVPGVYAVGDAVAGPLLAHRAMEEGYQVGERAAGRDPGPISEVMPAVVYTHPELATVGWTEKQAKGRGLEVRTGSFPLQASGRARTSGDADGLVKVVVEAGSERLLGVHILAAHASELIGVGACALAEGWTGSQLASVVFPHPSLGEALKESAMTIHRAAIHL